MKYISVAMWRDLSDHHLYGKGDTFPHDGREISPKRITELSGTQNKAGFAVIEPVPGEAKGKPVETPTTHRGRKKTANRPV